ncbi:MAG: endonuclease III [Phycisphaeraceae bacterium]|nr:endonuclease III [Phycisphaeraceae bacterium]
MAKKKTIAAGSPSQRTPPAQRRARSSTASLPAVPDAELRRRAKRIVGVLRRLYPDAHCELDHINPFQLLVATILSAQCTDKRVNMVTPALFARFPDARAMADADVREIEELVKTTGFFRNKARNIQGASQRIVEAFGGEVPQTMEELLTLPGVARKTANVVLGTAFKAPEGVVVDTHVQRLSRRMGLTERSDPVKIERDLMALFPRSQWDELSHLMIWHGRRCCDARKPDCDRCDLKDKLCPRVGVSIDVEGKESKRSGQRGVMTSGKTGRRGSRKSDDGNGTGQRSTGRRSASR